MASLSPAECGGIAERHLDVAAALSAAEALRRYGLGDAGEGPAEQVGWERGWPYLCRIWAWQPDERTVLLVARAEPYPGRDRRGVLGLLDAFRYGRDSGKALRSRSLSFGPAYRGDNRARDASSPGGEKD